MRIEIQWNSLFPLSMPYVTTLQYREIFWQNGSLLYGSDNAKQEFFMRLQFRLQSLHKHDFISNQLLFYCWLTQQHFNFSVSFSCKVAAPSFKPEIRLCEKTLIRQYQFIKQWVMIHENHCSLCIILHSRAEVTRMMLEQSQISFHDKEELLQATRFLHNNGEDFFVL